MDEPYYSIKYRAQVYDVALDAFFQLRKLDAEASKRGAVEVGWDIAEAFVAAAVSGVTYKSENKARWFDAAQLLRQFADMVEEDGLAGLGWGYKGDLDARQAWRPDIRSEAGQAELHARTLAVIRGTYRPLRALTVADRRAIICLSYAGNALNELETLTSEIEGGSQVRQMLVERAKAILDQFRADPDAADATDPKADPSGI